MMVICKKFSSFLDDFLRFFMILVWPLWLFVKLRRPVTRDWRIDLIGTVVCRTSLRASLHLSFFCSFSQKPLHFIWFKLFCSTLVTLGVNSKKHPTQYSYISITEQGTVGGPIPSHLGHRCHPLYEDYISIISRPVHLVNCGMENDSPLSVVETARTFGPPTSFLSPHRTSANSDFSDFFP